jgi:hypothetical protein
LTSDLHAQVDVLFPGAKHRLKRALVHALIDLGQVTSFECSWKDCVLPGVPLAPSGRFNDSTTLDHDEAIADGGSDDWRNIQLMHHTCNMRKGALFTETRRELISEAVRQRWQDPAYHARMAAATAAGNRTPEANDKRSASMRLHWSDPERAAKHNAGRLRGDAHWTRRPESKTPTACDICGQVCRGVSAMHLHQTRRHGRRS